MSYFVLRGVSKRAKSMTSFALALVMLFQAMGPGVFALRTANAVVLPDLPEGGETATVKVTKIICDDEEYLPNWGTNTNHSDIPNGIEEGTADAFLATEDGSHCHKDTGWQFQWLIDSINDYSNDPGRDFVGLAGDGWSAPFVGSASIELPENKTGKTIWVREVLKDGYIPFTYDSVDDPVDDVSAEIYCNDDHFHYDNYDNVGSLSNGATYHCVAFNVQVEDTSLEPCLLPNSVSNEDKINTFGVSPEIPLQKVLDDHYGVNAIVATSSDTGIEYWDIPVGTESVTISGKYINAIADNKQAFGYYFDGDASSITPVFKNHAGHTASTTTLSIGDSFSVEIDTAGHTKIGFVLDTQGSGPAKHETEKSLNGGEDRAVIFVNPENANGYVIAFEDLSDKDYQDLVVEVNIDDCESKGDECTPGSGSIVSGTTDTKADASDGEAVVLVNPIHDAWDANIPDASWVWSENPINDPVGTTTESFFHTFTITGNPASVILDIATDNSYEVYVNGNPVAIVSDDTANNFGAHDTHVLSPVAFQTGENIIEFRVTNWRQEGGTMESNPAGLMYKLSWTSNCDNGGGENPYGKQFEVHVAKYLDGSKATAESADEFDFPISANWNAQAQTPFPAQSGGDDFELSDENENDYEIVSPKINIHGNFEVMETAGENIVPIGGECAPGKYRLLGYKVGSSYANAEASDLIAETGFFEVTNLESDQYVIVYNESCPTDATITATKIVCTDEADLPNFGNGTGGPITSTTATEWVNSHDSCSLQAGWTFQWAPSGTANPGDNTGSAGAPWTSTGATIADGTITFDIPVVTNGDYVWMREVMQDGYIPFTGLTTTEDVSAELYCGIDHLNYDNYDRIDNLVAGNNYNCVAWNVPTEPTNPGMVKVTIDKFIDGVKATAQTADNQSFPMVSSWDAVNSGPGNGSYTLGPVGFNSPNAYEAITSNMTSGASYATSEDLSGQTVGASCREDKPFALVGYTWGDTYVEASGGVATTSSPDFTNITTDKYVIVWNESCDDDTDPGETFTYGTTTIMMADLATGLPDVLLDPTKWFFYNDESDTIDNSIGSFVFGPSVAPLGDGSAEMTVSGTQRRNIATYQFNDVPLSSIKTLRFSTYSQSAGNGSPASERSAYLHFNVDFDNSDNWQYRLVYVPSVNGVVVNDTWQSWDALDNGNALWTWSRYASNGNKWPDNNPNQYRTWNDIVTSFPNAETRSTDSWFGFRVGEPYSDGFTGELDNVVIGIKSGSNTHTETYDFEPEPITTSCVDNCGDDNISRQSSSRIVRGSSDSSDDDEGLVAGASDLPGLPNTGNGENSQVFMTVLTLVMALVALNMVGIRLARKN